MTEVFRLAGRFVEELCSLDPFMATAIGEPGYDAQVTDYSPEGVEARVGLARTTLRALDKAVIANRDDGIAVAVMRDRLEVQLERYEAGHYWQQLSNIVSPITFIRAAFDLCPRVTPEDWEHIAIRMARVPDALAGFTGSLRKGLAMASIAPRRQALVCAGQAATLGGEAGSDEPYFLAIAAEGASRGGPPDRLREGALAATSAYAEQARFLRDEYASRAPESDAVGEERYALGVREWLGGSYDLREVYAWGWDELQRIDAERQVVAEQIAPGAGLGGVMTLLQEDPGRSLERVDQVLGFLQEMTDRTIAELDGVHFDIPAPLHRIECRLAPPGTAAAAYYTPPSADFSRPGRTWYPTRGRTRFPLWTEVTTSYHEGVPGHHLQLGLCMTFQDRLTRFQRELGIYSGYAEGWALYAERLMQELGYLENPDHLFGMLTAQAFRAMRVVVDIGLHLQLEIPRNQPYLPGETWNWNTALPFVQRYVHTSDRAFVRSELERYCGMPAQAISYKVGERTWLDIRSQLRARLGGDFNLKRFHMDALHMGSLPLDLLERELLG